MKKYAKKIIKTSLLAGAAGVLTLAGAVYLRQLMSGPKPKIMYTLNGYSISKREKNGSCTVFSYSNPVFWKEQTHTLYLGLDTQTLADDLLLMDSGCDGKVDVIRTASGITIRAAATLEELLNLSIGTKESFKEADKILAEYKKELSKEISQAEEAVKNLNFK